MNLANFICRRCIKTGSDKTPTGCASKLETVRPFWHSASHPSSTILSRRRVQFTFDRTCNYRVGILPLKILLSIFINFSGNEIEFRKDERTNERNSFCLRVSWDTFATDEKKCNILCERFKICVRKLSTTSRAAHFYRTLAYHKKTNRPFPAPVGLYLYSQRFEISLLRFLMFVPESGK